MTDFDDRQYSFKQAEAVVDLAVTLVDYTESTEQCRKIPFVLSRAFNIDCVSLAATRLPIGDQLLPDEQASPFVFCYGFGHHPDFCNDQKLKQLVRGLYHQIAPHFSNNPSPHCQVYHARHLDQSVSEVDGKYDETSRLVVISRMIDSGYHMMLVGHKRFGNYGIPATVLDNLSFLALELSKQLRITVAWADSPRLLGPPFDVLTSHELRIVSGLRSELSEKELATQLSLSCHTLHSHIKSIYRKIGVQGRIPLLLRLHSADRRMRRDSHGALGNSI